MWTIFGLAISAAIRILLPLYAPVLIPLSNAIIDLIKNSESKHATIMALHEHVKNFEDRGPVPR